jgi:hypothetical protein
MEPTIIAPPDVNVPNNEHGPVWRSAGQDRSPLEWSGLRWRHRVGLGRRRRPGQGRRDIGPGEGGGFGGGVFRVGGGVTAPVPLYRPEPEYSEEARKAKYQGTVVLYVEVDRQQASRENLKVDAQPGARAGREGHRGGGESGSSALATRMASPSPWPPPIEVNFRLSVGTGGYCFVRPSRCPSPRSPISTLPFIFLSLSIVPV